MFRFEGGAPDEDEVAAIVSALEQFFSNQAPAPPPQSAWKLSARHPDLDYDELRALARGVHDVR